MGFEKLEKAVLEKARKDADSIVSEAKKKADAVLEQARQEADRAAEKYKSETKRLVEQIRNREIASGRLDAKKLMLQSKKELSEKVFLKAAKDIPKKLTKAQKQKILTKLVDNAKAQMDVGQIFCSKDDIALVPGAKAKDILGGVIAESKDGTTMIDYSFETMLQDVREKNIAEVSAILSK